MLNEDIVKIFKSNNKTYILHIANSYIQLTNYEVHNNKTVIPWISISCIKEPDGSINYTFMQYGDKFNIPNVKKLDVFKALMILEKYFPSKISTIFLNTCNKYGFTSSIE